MSPQQKATAAVAAVVVVAAATGLALTQRDDAPAPPPATTAQGPASAARPATAPAAPAPARATATGYRLVRVAGNLGDPLYVTAAPGRPNRLYVVRQSGTVVILERGRRLPRPFLDVRGAIRSGGEQGLLGLAFHPEYARNRRLFVNYTDRAGDTRVVEYRANAAGTAVAPGSARVLLSQDQPYSNHNGGMLAFGPDRRLYIGLGDGGGGGDPLRAGQDLSTFLGKILRIDVDGRRPYAVPGDNPFRGVSGARGEIWHYGLRNPWRFSFDRGTGDMWIGDVGQNALEEISRAPAGRGGLNFGWNAFEGRRRFGGTLRPGSRHTPPVTQYGRDRGVSVTGGYVYRGPAVPALRGRYLFADYGTGRVWSIRAGARPGGLREETGRLGVRLGNITSFGEGAGGELYVLSGDGLYRLARR
ncbi:MAG TPA: PQQ-dependent sugar dehydrogenase [Miltoncostaeaceae bacterium]|nr:PQQ-dependent sugar dehydrogenase [Miltoncostaeaceae bacterium]